MLGTVLGTHPAHISQGLRLLENLNAVIRCSAQKQPKPNLATVSFYDCVNDNRELVLLPFLTLPSAGDSVVTVSGR